MVKLNSLPVGTTFRFNHSYWTIVEHQDENGAYGEHSIVNRCRDAADSQTEPTPLCGCSSSAVHPVALCSGGHSSE